MMIAQHSGAAGFAARIALANLLTAQQLYNQIIIQRIRRFVYGGDSLASEQLSVSLSRCDGHLSKKNGLMAHLRNSAR